jgi:hypothetical protein
MFNKNLTNVKQLLLSNYSLDDAITLCNYDAKDKEMVEQKLKTFLLLLNKDKDNKNNNVTINIS